MTASERDARIDALRRAAPRSRLLVNKSTPGAVKFVESTPPALAEFGMVTSALWSDVDGDGWNDLIVAAEWGPVSFFKNTVNQFQ